MKEGDVIINDVRERKGQDFWDGMDGIGWDSMG